MNVTIRNRVAAGLCSRGCGRPLATKTNCRACADQNCLEAKERATARVRAGLCSTGCGRFLSTRVYCRQCADKHSERGRGDGVIGETRALIRERITECQACQTAFSGSGNIGTAQVIDHDHKTGRARGVLCGHCNKALGHLQDDLGRILALASYLKRAQ